MLKSYSLAAILVMSTAFLMGDGLAHAEEPSIDKDPQQKSWFAKRWTRAEKAIVQEGDQVTVTPKGDSRYPILVLQVPVVKHINANFYFWEGVRAYADNEPEYAISEFNKASQTEPPLDHLQETLMVVTEAHALMQQRAQQE